MEGEVEVLVEAAKDLRSVDFVNALGFGGDLVGGTRNTMEQEVLGDDGELLEPCFAGPVCGHS